MKDFMKTLDHPLLFLFFLLLALTGLSSVVTWGFKAAGLNGPATLIQHP